MSSQSNLRRWADEALPVGCGVVAGLVLGCAALTGFIVWARALWGWVF